MQHNSGINRIDVKEAYSGIYQGTEGFNSTQQQFLDKTQHSEYNKFDVFQQSKAQLSQNWQQGEIEKWVRIINWIFYVLLFLSIVIVCLAFYGLFNSKFTKGSDPALLKILSALSNGGTKVLVTTIVGLMSLLLLPPYITHLSVKNGDLTGAKVSLVMNFLLMVLEIWYYSFTIVLLVPAVIEFCYIVATVKWLMHMNKQPKTIG